MNAKELAGAGRLTAALAALQSEIRQNPGDQKLRIFLFQLECLLGRLDKALIQLQVVASLGAESMMLARIFQQVIACEMLRRDVFAGARTPLIFGEPNEWIGLLVQANALAGGSHFDAASEMRIRAFEMAPSTSGKVNGEPFEWLADADSRLGPLLELILDGKYYWVPFNRVARIDIEKPADLRDLVWIPARFVWTNGGAVSGHIPVRYAGTEPSGDDGLRMARATTWREPVAGYFLGLGQRVLATDTGEYPLLDCRSVEFAQNA